MTAFRAIYYAFSRKLKNKKMAFCGYQELVTVKQNLWPWDDIFLFLPIVIDLFHLDSHVCNDKLVVIKVNWWKLNWIRAHDPFGSFRDVTSDSQRLLWLSLLSVSNLSMSLLRNMSVPALTRHGLRRAWLTIRRNHVIETKLFLGPAVKRMGRKRKCWSNRSCLGLGKKNKNRIGNLS